MLEAIVGHNVHILVPLVQMGMFGYSKIPDVILSLVSPEKLNWTHTFDTHCISYSFSFCDYVCTTIGSTSMSK